MIPIVSIFNSVACLITVAIFAHLWRSYKIRGNENIKLFSFFYFFEALFLFFIAIPGIVLMDEALIAYAASLSYFFLYAALAYASRIPLIVNMKTRKRLFTTIIALGVLIFFASILYSSPAIRVNADPYYFYIVQEEGLLRTLIGLIPFIVGISIIVAFIAEGKKGSQEGDVHITHKSYIIAFGFFILVCAASLNFFLPPRPLSFLAASITSIVGWLTILSGIVRLKRSL